MKVKNLKNINISDFEILFKEFYNDLCNYALKYTKNKEDAEEVVQNVFFKIWGKRSFIDVQISTKSYLYICVRNKCLQNINHNKVVKIYEKYVEKEQRNYFETPHEEMVFEETLAILNEIINNLPKKANTIFTLSRFKGLKNKEIAEKLQISIKTVEANITIALKTLRTYFPKQQ